MMSDEKECALLIDMTFDKLKMKTGILITVPVPKEQVIRERKNINIIYYERKLME